MRGNLSCCLSLVAESSAGRAQMGRAAEVWEGRCHEHDPGESSSSGQATRAYLHAEADVEAALNRAGLRVTRREMTATQFYFSRLLEAKRA